MHASDALIEPLRRHLEATQGGPVDRVETHISWLLLTPKFAFKIKKPLRLSFLDFSSLELRRHFCEEELRLNRRLASDLYLDVVDIRGTPDAPTFAASGDVVEVALKMRRFPAGSLMTERLATGKLDATHIDRFAERLAEFHRTAPAVEPGSRFGAPECIVAQAAGTLDGIEQHGADGAALRAWIAEQSKALTPWWVERQSAGQVRECHGDLHLANALVLGDDVTAFDGIEFDPALRWIDVLSDSAFFAMDLIAHGRRDFAYRFLNAYLEHSGDYAGLPVLRFYMVYRALVRAHVALIRERQAGPMPAGPDYLALAHQLASESDARLLITHGLPGSGKTFVTQRLLEQVGAIRLRSDVERKRLFGLTALESSADRPRDEIYGPQATADAYARLRSLARTALSAGYPTIVDAANLREAERTQFRELAAELNVSFTILDCEASHGVLRERVSARLARRDDASEADLAVLERLHAVRELLTPAERAQAVMVDTQDGRVWLWEGADVGTRAWAEAAERG